MIEISDNIILRRELLKVLNENMTGNELLMFLRKQQWSTGDQESYKMIQDNCNGEKVQDFVESYIDLLELKKNQKEGQMRLIQQIQQEIEDMKQEIKNMPEYPMAFVTFEKVVCRLNPDHMNIYYKIEPSNHSGAILLQINDRETEINEQYTLELPNRKFEIVFFQEGTQIGQYYFNGLDFNQKQERQQSILLQRSIVVFVKIKYANKKISLQQQIDKTVYNLQKQQQNLRQIARIYTNLENFSRYFYPQHQIQPVQQSLIPTKQQTFNHVRNSYYLLQIQMLSQCLSSFCSPISFLSMIIPIYLLLKIHDTTPNISLNFAICILCQSLLIIYTLISLFLNINNTQNNTFVYLNCLVEIVSMFFVGIIALNEKEFKKQADELVIRRR